MVSHFLAHQEIKFPPKTKRTCLDIEGVEPVETIASPKWNIINLFPFPNIILTLPRIGSFENYHHFLSSKCGRARFVVPIELPIYLIPCNIPSYMGPGLVGLGKTLSCLLILWIRKVSCIW